MENNWPYIDSKTLERIDDYIMAPGWNKNFIGVILGTSFNDEFPADGHIIQSRVKRLYLRNTIKGYMMEGLIPRYDLPQKKEDNNDDENE